MKEKLSVESELDRLEKIWSHIKNVQNNCYKLSRELVKEDRVDLARKLLQRAGRHDSSKFTDLEYYGMYSDDKLIKEIAINHHRNVNEHHLDYHSSPLDMDDLDLAEMACDLKARSSEFGTDIKEYVRSFCESRNISVNTKFYKSIVKFLNMILEEKF